MSKQIKKQKKENFNAPSSSFDKVMAFLQIFLIILTLFLIFYFLIKKQYSPSFQLLLAGDLFVMAYNTNRVYQKKKSAILYVVIGFMLILLYLLLKMGVNF